MEIVKILRSQELRWPDTCAYCGQTMHAYAESKHSTISGVNPLLSTYTRSFVTVSYPVCKLHRRLGGFNGFLSHQSFVDLFVGFLFLPILLVLPLLAVPLLRDHVLMPLLMLLWCAYPFAVFFMKMRMPVRVVACDQTTASIGFSSDDYGRRFRELNQPVERKFPPFQKL
ncbi:hypothetical protein D0B54_18045 [Solimonas sp. K1W22B-7]|uniref:hypothetical protein n=1 Tax=Solimonas sp. K1W22B-7 TaxID=2303331 RepID=UPI000E32FF69|nr:hypothetical protein [Solimonas sp. K1W22B-7]AXQ30462.1 hypothetical protein D0B54_18045 [Solimonas sp. K1W22B-7]